jgi:cytochrome P450
MSVAKADLPPLKTAPLGLPLLAFIRKDPLGAASEFKARFGDIAKLHILFRRIYYIFNPEAAREILIDQQTFTREVRLLEIFQTFQGRNVLTTDGPDWERQRRILTPGFSAKRIAGYISLMNAATMDCLQNELPTTPGTSALIDASQLTTRITMDVIVRTLFSQTATREQADSISDAIRALSAQSMREAFWPIVPRMWMPYPGRTNKLRSKAVIDDFIADHIRVRQSATDSAAPANDVLAMMLSARDDDSKAQNAALSAQEVHDNCVVLFGAGFDTSASALAWWLGLIATNPVVATQLRDELSVANAKKPAALENIARLPYLNATIKEAMRLYPPSTSPFTRVALRDVVIDGTQVTKGTLLAIQTWHLHHDARSFPDPETFRPERFLPGAAPFPRGAFMPFGAGPHFCLGQHFATVEMAIIAAAIIQHFDLSLEAGAALPDAVVDLTLKPKTPLRVRITRRYMQR